MDCDGPKHALVRDVDGIFWGALITEGSIAPFAKLRLDNCCCQSIYIYILTV